MKHLEHTPETYLYSHYNMCNIPIYFCNVDIQHLQHISKISETLKTYYCNMRFQHSICLLLGRMEAHWHGARRRRGARCREVAQRSSVWSSAATWTSVRAGAGGRSMAATGGTSPGRGTWRERGWRDRGRGPSRSRDAQRAERAGDTGKGGAGDLYGIDRFLYPVPASLSLRAWAWHDTHVYVRARRCACATENKMAPKRCGKQP
jgi:hypothetical protein